MKKVDLKTSTRFTALFTLMAFISTFGINGCQIAVPVGSSQAGIPADAVIVQVLPDVQSVAVKPSSVYHDQVVIQMGNITTVSNNLSVYVGDPTNTNNTAMKTAAQNAPAYSRYFNQYICSVAVNKINQQFSRYAIQTSASLKSVSLPQKSSGAESINTNMLSDEEISNYVKLAVDMVSNVLQSNALETGYQIQSDIGSNMQSYLISEATNDTNFLNGLSNSYEESKPVYYSKNGISASGIVTMALNSGAVYTNRLLSEEYVKANAKSGDILWVAYNNFGNSQILSGHTGVYYWDTINSTPKVLGILPGNNSDGQYQKAGYYPLSAHTKDDTIQSGKHLIVNGKSAIEGKTRVEAAYTKYHGLPFATPLDKKYYQDGVYCSQLSWLTWNDQIPGYSSIDIDGSSSPQGNWFQGLIWSTVPLSINIFGFYIVVFIAVLILVWFWVTFDMCQPWDIVISGKTTETAWWGSYRDHP